MTPDSARLAVDWLRQHAAVIADLLPAWQSTIARELAAHDSLPNGTGADTARHTGGTTTPVEAAVLARAPTIDHWHDICDRLDTTCAVLRGVVADMRCHIGTTPHPVPRCTATGRDGNLEWSDPACTAIASRGPLCDRCAKREWRWRQDHGLPPRRDGLFSGDAA